MSDAAANRAISIMTAYCETVANPVDSDEENEAGLILFDLLDELTTPLIHAGRGGVLDGPLPDSAERAKNEFNSTIMRILGIMQELMDNLEINPFDLISEVAQANHRREV